MKILVANLGSTSFKYRLFDMPDERLLARGSVERIGAEQSRCVVETGGRVMESAEPVPDHADAVRRCLQQLTDPQSGCLASADEVSAIGFKTVHGGRLSGVQLVTDDVLDAMAEMNQIAPAHNPPYIAAMQQMRRRLPEIPLVAAFETDFHSTIPARNWSYGIPHEWEQALHIRRWGFHGASHRYIATRIAQIVGRADLRVISCHLGGSSSLAAIRNGASVATSMGVSPQSGLLQNNRVGDFDPFALPLIMERTGLSLDDVLSRLASEGGLLGISGVSGDLRDLQQAADEGNPRAQLAIETYISNIRQYLGWMLVELCGADVIVFTGGIGEHGADIRARTCADLHALGIELDSDANQVAEGERCISTEASRVQVWVVPTQEELVVARQACQLLQTSP